MKDCWLMAKQSGFAKMFQSAITTFKAYQFWLCWFYRNFFINWFEVPLMKSWFNATWKKAFFFFSIFYQHIHQNCSLSFPSCDLFCETKIKSSVSALHLTFPPIWFLNKDFLYFDSASYFLANLLDILTLVWHPAKYLGKGCTKNNHSKSYILPISNDSKLPDTWGSKGNLAFLVYILLAKNEACMCQIGPGKKVNQFKKRKIFSDH